MRGRVDGAVLPELIPAHRHLHSYPLISLAYFSGDWLVGDDTRLSNYSFVLAEKSRKFVQQEMLYFGQVDGFLILFFGLISITALTAISVIRYIKGCQPQHACHINKQNLGLAIAAVWLFSLFWAEEPLLGWGSYRGVPDSVCGLPLGLVPIRSISMWSKYQVPLLNCILASLFAKSASFYNPFIYVGMSSKFRKDLQALFPCLRPGEFQIPSPTALVAQPHNLQLHPNPFKVAGEEESPESGVEMSNIEGVSNSVQNDRQESPHPHYPLNGGK